MDTVRVTRRLLWLFALAVLVLGLLSLHSSALSSAMTHHVGVHHGASEPAAHGPVPARSPGLVGQSVAPVRAASVLSAEPGSRGLGADQECPGGCPHHHLTVGACLLALTLLVFSWRLLPPRLRLRPPQPAPTIPPRLLLRPRRVPVLRLAELTVLRV